MEKKKILILIIAGAILIFLAIAVFFTLKLRRVVMVTDKTEYKGEESLQLKVKNGLTANICFSSCYPYYLERKEGKWIRYDYQECNYVDVVERCLNPRKERTFGITLPSLKVGVHRLAIPICKNCKVGNEFGMTQTIYSNEFEIKD